MVFWGMIFFANYPVLIDYQRKFLWVNAPTDTKRWTRKKTIHFPLIFHARKPHIALEIETAQQLLRGELMLDSGLSDALWLFSTTQPIVKNPPTFADFLGTGINGEVYGFRGKLPFVNFQHLRLNQVKVAYPTIDGQHLPVQFSANRIGSIGAEFLSRFKILFDYHNKKVSFYPTRNIDKPFYYNLSGLEFEYDGVQLIRRKLNPIQQNDTKGGKGGIEIMLHDRYTLEFYPALTITFVRPGSPAHHAGVKTGDIIQQINGKRVHQMRLEKVHGLLQKEPGTRINLVIERNGKPMKFSFRLVSILTSLKPSP